MGYYINCITRSDRLTRDVKELIPDMNSRRRMNRVVKMGVSTAIESILDFEPYREIDAIITATGLGCIGDSEKFLSNIITAEEQLLNPTAFIQSTFNTVGAQIALIRSLHCYNNTFTHSYTSFESALIDAMIQIDSGNAQAVAVGIFDEITPTLEIIMTRLGALKEKPLGEGSIFFVLTPDRLNCSVAEIDSISFGTTTNSSYITLSKSCETIWSGAVAEVMLSVIEQGKDGAIFNDLELEYNSLIKLKCLSQ